MEEISFKPQKGIMMRLRSFIALFIGIILVGHSAFAEDVLPVKESDSFIHVSEELSSAFLHLVIDANVQPVETGTQLPTYRTTYPSSTKEAWLDVFFGDPQAKVIDYLEGKSEKELLSNLIADADRERAYSLGEKSTRYQSLFCALVYNSTAREIVSDIFSAIENAQANGLSMTPEQARKTAENWIEPLSSKLGWKGFLLSHTYALPSNDGKQVEDLNNYIATGIYLVEYERFLNGLPVARDVLPSSEIEGDLLQLYINDEGVLRICGVCRDYIEQGSAVINISLEDALIILEENMDYVNAFPKDDSDGFVINEVGLCWRLIPTLTQDNWDYNAVMEARPAWRFASNICRNQTDVFVMYIDAETGEVLE